VTALETTDGRTLDVRTWGDPAAPVLVYLHGTPASALVPPVAVSSALERGLRVVAWSRPGYAGSSRAQGRRVVDVAVDAREVLDALEVETAVAVGYSGGGPHVLACAAMLPERFRAVAVLAGVAPRVESAPDMDWFAGQGQDNIDEHRAALEGEDRLRAHLAPLMPVFEAMSAEQVVAEMGGLLADVDRAYLGGELGEWLAASFREAVSSGPDGWVDDDLAFVAPWGFRLGMIDVPVTVWHGSDDLMAPFAHGEWLCDAIPGTVERLLSGEGHLSVVVGQFARLLDELVEAGA
jgi:pimeloyl-ACP methyl ester carboxylesterase